MPLVPLHKALAKALKGRYALGAFNAVSADFLEAILAAAKSERSPVIVNLAEVHFPYLTPERLAPVVKAWIKDCPVDVVLNLDHGKSFESCVRAAKAGFSSVMIDGSSLPYAQNAALTRKVVKHCHAKGVSVEAELGSVGGEEGGVAKVPSSGLFTDPAQAAEFMRATGADALAVAIGNAHGRYQGVPKLDFRRLAQIRRACRAPLVLHGGTGIPAAGFRRAIGMGVAKINYYTGMSQAALAATRKGLEKGGRNYNEYPDLAAAVKSAVRAEVAAQMRVFMSSGKG